MSLEVGVVGLPNSGKTTLFNVLTQAHADVTPYATVADKPHVGMAPIHDGRLEQVAAVVGSPKVTPATIRILDAPGTGPALLGNLREADALFAVLDGFSTDADPAGDLENLELELLVADRDHVEKRLERIRRQAKSGEPKLRQEVEALERLLQHLEAGNTLKDYAEPLPPELQPLTTKPVLTVVNGPDGIDLKLELELADLDAEEAAEFRDGPPALEEVVRRLFGELDLITFFTANEKEARGWTLQAGRSALEAAAQVHTEIAHGFVRCEVIPWRDLVDAGSRAEAARRGVQRLEGRTYAVQDGDVLQIRFTH